jgi:hypothetical protein
MTGVEILAAQEIVTACEFNWKAYFITIAILSIVMTVIAFFNLNDGFAGAVVGLITGVIFGAILGLIPATHTTPSEYETQYKVIVSDEVLMNDFLERYKIISQEGKIYTVR